MNLRISSAVFLLLAAGAGQLAAQNPGAMDQVNSVQQRRQLDASTHFKEGDSAPDIYPGESSDTGPQSVLLIKPRRTLVEGVLDSQYFYTDNAYLERDTHKPSGVLVSTAQVALAPSPYDLFGGESTPRIGFRQQWYDFLEYKTHTPDYNQADFNIQTIFADERWARGNWVFGVGFDFNRLLTQTTYRQFYEEYVPRWEVMRIFPLAEKHAASVSYQGYWHWSHAPNLFQPHSNFYDRLDSELLATYNFTPCRFAVFQPYVSFKQTHFTTLPREDYVYSAGLAFYCMINDWVSVRPFISYDRKFSSTHQDGYARFTGGGGVNLTVRF